MKVDQNQINKLISNPIKSRNVKIKRWIYTTTPLGQQKVIKNTFALRNLNGGFFIFGFEDNGMPSANPPDNIREEFHIDTVQALVSRHASEFFEISIAFGTSGDLEFPVICIPPGVQTPVSVKKPLMDGRTKLIERGEVFFRTLAANGTPSTSCVMPEDWQELIGICFDNREADIGRFLRRQLAGEDLKSLMTALQQIFLTREASVAPTSTLELRARGLFDDE